MTITVPLSVRLRTGVRDIHVTDEIADVSFGSSSPGGYTECTLSLYRPIRFVPAEVTQFSRMYVYDSRTGLTVWEGRLQDPGRTAGDDGEVYQLVGVGGQAHLQDDTRALIYVDTNTESWDQIDLTTAGSEVQKIPDTGASTSVETPAVTLRIPQGTAVDGGIPSRVVAAHRGLAAAGMVMARVSFDWDAGLTTANITAALYAATEGVGAADVPWSATFNTAGGTIARVINSHWLTTRNRPIIRFHYTGAAAPGGPSTDTWWLQFTSLTVRGMLYTQDGTARTAGANYTVDTVLASEIVADYLGRVMTSTFDSANATITATSFGIEHLAYPDAVTGEQLLGDLMKFETGYTYHVWESNPANDKFRFEWLPWPTAVRYEADVIDGFSAPASGNTLYNAVAVRWHNRGTIRVSTRTQAVKELTAAGMTRTGFIDLGDEASTQANAHRTGDQWLAEHQRPTNSGRLIVRVPIVDHLLGRMVSPWELRAGNLIRIRGVEAYPDSLNNAGRDGVSVFKIASTDFSASAAAVVLELDSYTPSAARALATLIRRPVVRRR
jgi:hypothetical protein